MLRIGRLGRDTISGQFILFMGDQMAIIEVSDTLRLLKNKRNQISKELGDLDKAITALQELEGSGSASNGTFKKRTLSVAARKKIAAAQKLRWAKVRAKAAKS
jgi:hypothetical protein